MLADCRVALARNGEYAAEFATDDWPGAIAKNKVRLNVWYTIPVG